MRANPNINYRYLVKPDAKLIREFNLVDFKPKRSQKLIEDGRKEAEKVVALGSGTVFRDFYNLNEKAPSSKTGPF